jgi:hypothetical protein
LETLQRPSKVVSRLTSTLVLVSFFLYVLCFFTPAYQIVGLKPADGTYSGLFAFVWGPVGLFGGHFSWLANPVFWFSWVGLWREKQGLALAASVIALLIALSFLLNETIPVGSSGPFQYKALYGYYIWVGSMGLTAFAAVVGMVAEAHVGQSQGAP